VSTIVPVKPGLLAQQPQSVADVLDQCAYHLSPPSPYLPLTVETRTIPSHPLDISEPSLRPPPGLLFGEAGRDEFFGQALEMKGELGLEVGELLPPLLARALVEWVHPKPTWRGAP